MDIHGAVAHTTMLNGYVDVKNSETTALRVGSSNLPERKWLYLRCAAGGSGATVYIGSQSSRGIAVTTTTLAKSGIKMKAGQDLWLPVSDAITVYGMSNTGAGKRIIVMELA
jgi:hypothetical protein